MGDVLKLTRAELPENSVIAVFSDVHIPHQDEAALKLAVECCERAGVTHVILNGDIADCGPASRHEGKRRAAILDEGDLQESIEPGKWFLNWARTRPCWWLFGNHERWVEKCIAEQPEIHGMSPTSLLGVPADGNGWRVLPSTASIRIGNRVFEHGHAFFPSGTGGKNPWNRIRDLAPDQTTSIGHTHRMWRVVWTTRDEDGVPRTRASLGNGHMSVPESHDDYAGHTSWQQSFEITRAWWDGGKPRFTTDQIEVHRDRRNRPVFEYGGYVYK